MTAPVTFAGSRSGEGGLTWGQQSIWLAMRQTGEDDAYFNFGRIVAAPRRAGPLAVPAAAAAVARVVERHEALRTRLAEVSAEPVQILAATGTIEAEVVEAAGEQPAAVAERLLESLRGRRFDYVADWPLRVGLVTVGGTVSHIVLVFCHIATDGHGADVTARDLRLLLLRGQVPGTPPQPLDMAREQRTPAGIEAGRAAPRYWEPELHRLPPTMFGTPSGDPSDPPWQAALLTSPALDAASRRVAARTGASTSSVLLAGAAALIGGLTGHPVCALYPVVSNRFRADTLDLVSPMAQDGLFVLDLTARTFDDLVAATWQAALRAYRRAEFEPAAWLEMLGRVRAARGIPVRLQCCINDQRPADLASTGREVPSLGDIAAALPATTLGWVRELEQLNCRFCLHLAGAPGGLGVTATADTRYLAAPDILRFLRALEALVVSAAGGDVPLPELPELLDRTARPPAGALVPAG